MSTDPADPPTVVLPCPVCSARVEVYRRASNVAMAPPIEVWHDELHRSGRTQGWVDDEMKRRRTRELVEETVQCDVCTTVSDVVRRVRVRGCEHRRPIVLAPRLSQEQRNVLVLRIGLGVTVPTAVLKAALDLEREWREWLKDDDQLPSDEMLNAMGELLDGALGRKAEIGDGS